MKKFLVIGVVVIIIVFAIFSWIKPYTDMFKFESFPNTSENRIQIIEDRGYTITEIYENVDTYTLTKAGLVQQYMSEWSVQSIDPTKYVGKNIEVYRYKVKNHKLDSMGDMNETVLSLMACNGKVIGGYSYILNSEPLLGGVYNIDGFTLEEVTGKMYTTWVKEWMKKYQ